LISHNFIKNYQNFKRNIILTMIWPLNWFCI